MADQLELAALYQGVAANVSNKDCRTRILHRSLFARNGNQPEACRAVTGNYRLPRTARNKETGTRRKPVHRPTPYADIPSLYDLLRSGHLQGTELRSVFGAQVFPRWP